MAFQTDHLRERDRQETEMLGMVDGAAEPGDAAEPYRNTQPKIRLSRRRIVELRRIADENGKLTFVEQYKHMPSGIKMVCYPYDVTRWWRERGTCTQALERLIVAASGSFDLILDDGFERKRLHVNSSYYGLYICRGTQKLNNEARSQRLLGMS